MPELPEVEVTRLSFAPAIAGAKVLDVRVGLPLRWPLGCEPGALLGRQVLQVRRRGKYLLIDLSTGLLLVHLGMSGSLRFGPPGLPAGKHDHFDLLTDRGLLRLHDPRRFGAVVYADSEQHAVAQKLLGHLGVEPLGDGFSAQMFADGLKKRQAPVKQVLLAGELVVGVGNIYASEALFLACIRPTTRSSRISKPRAARLHRAICDVLAQAVAQGGSSLRDFSNAQGQNGYFQLQANVYDRTGQACRVCAAPIKRLVQGQRSTFYCPLCQKP
ncbi:MAG: bifunctional DNA-formamidopyrimidine glycosylase/DNA-(apurinic or apyrimidinic site) lyase [Limnohabitans sp.]|nr:bifunctional DNA-formamidopyrimidine glycosylase/DNA-(apurinic or apyrimidinic site) lyase [Limnohabitans sp.]